MIAMEQFAMVLLMKMAMACAIIVLYKVAEMLEDIMVVMGVAAHKE